jgi:hypothetical protein
VSKAQSTAQNNLSKSQANYNNARSAQSKHQKGYVNIQNQINAQQKNLARFRPGTRQYNDINNAINRLKTNNDYKNWTNYQNQMNSYAKQNTTYSNQVNSYRNQVNSWNSKIQDQQRNVLAPREQALQKANTELTNHNNTIKATSAQIGKLAESSGASSKAAEKAMADAQALQEKITNYQTRSEPLKDLEGKIEGDYASATKASTEELKKIAANSLDPVSQKNAQNLLNQRAEQIAKTYGKSVDQVKQEMGTAVGQLQGEQFKSQEDFNKFMGIEAAKQAELQDPGALNNLQEQVAPPPPGNPEQATIQPVGAPQPIAPVQPPTKDAGTSASPTTPPRNEPNPGGSGGLAQPNLGVPPAPAQPQTPPQVQQQAPQVQQLQNQGQAQTTGMPANPAPAPQPTQPNMPQQQPAAQQASGMPKPPASQPQAAFGAINPYVKQGMASQIRQGFQNAMKIKATPQTTQPKPPAQPAVDPMVARRQAVAAQAMGIAAKPTAFQQQAVAQKQDESKAFGMNQNVKLNQGQNTVNSGTGRRQPR